jgi:SAM-dependent methyltransferase
LEGYSVKYDTKLVEPLHASLFGQLHATYFDTFHRAKDYRAEVDQIRDVFTREGSVSSVLDLGCGTGRHLELLAESWYRVLGVDRSGPMVARAGRRLARFGEAAGVVESDLFELALDRTFDAVIMMFSLMGYFVQNERVLGALAVMARHLEPGGLVVFDVEDAATVLGAKTPISGGTARTVGAHPLLTGHTTGVNPDEQVIEMALDMWQLDGEAVLDEVHETHLIRYFTKRELRLLLDTAGFDLLGHAPLAGAAGNVSQPWLRLVWARKR